MDVYGVEYVVIVLFGVVIIFLLFIMYVMQGRMNQMLTEINSLRGAVDDTCTELEELSKNVEASIKLSVAQHVKCEFKDFQENIVHPENG